MEKISILAPAKINLYLDVMARRPDGYHDIETVMQTVTLFDRVSVEKQEAVGESKLNVRCRDFMAPEGAANTVFRAAEVFFAETGITEYHVSFMLDKKIPAEAGLGGGSADAAAALIALNQLYKTGLSTEALCAMGAKVGADVPFCLKKGTASAYGIGEILTSCTPMPDCAIVIALPGSNRISTKEAYQRIDSVHTEAPLSCGAFIESLLSCDLEKISTGLFNQFETVTPEEIGSGALCRKLIELGAVGARMSGSGPAVFGLFRDLPAARAARTALGDEIPTFVCTPARRDYPYIES